MKKDRKKASKNIMKCCRWLPVLLLCLLWGCSSPAQQPETEPAPETGAAAEDVLYLTVATSGSWRNVSRGRLFDKYAENLRKWSDGAMDILLYDDGALGDDLQLIEGVKAGTLNIINCVPSYLTSAVPEAALLDIPTVFSDVTAFNRLMDGGYFEVMQQYFADNGLMLLSCRAYDMRQMTSNVKVRNSGDLQGLKLRTMEVEYQIAFWQAMGAMTIPLSFTQVKTALSMGTIEAQENPLYYLESIKLSDVQDYIILTNHLPMVSCYVMNSRQWSAMTEEQQDLLLRFMDEMMDELVVETRKENESLIEKADSMGMTVVRPALTQELGEARDVVIRMLRERLGDKKVDGYLEAAEAANREP